MQPRRLILRRLLVILLASIAPLTASCSGRPVPVPSGQYTILSEQPDPATETDTISIRLPSATEAGARAAAAAIIESRREKFRRITVRAFLDSQTEGAPPYLVASWEGGEISTRFNPQAGSVRIPTH